MNHLNLRLLCVLCASVVTPAKEATGQALPRVVIQTELGKIEVEVDSVHAPVTAANFLRYVDLDFYKYGRFYRTVRADNQPDSKVKIAVIQAGLEPLKVKEFPPIPLERTNVTKISHRDGTISMARGDPNSATAEFFICVGDQPQLDFKGKRNPDGQGFAAFGRVIMGMDVVRRIHIAPAKGQQLTPPVRIIKVTRRPGTISG